MATATAARGDLTATSPSRPRRRRFQRLLVGLGVTLAVLVVWEGAKFLGGTPWRAPLAQPGSPVLWDPPFRWAFANDLNLPHVWNIALTFGQPFQRGAAATVAQQLFGAALFTWAEAIAGFALGTAIGLVLATLFVHSRLAERAFVPYIVASQTIPIIALAPMI